MKPLIGMLLVLMMGCGSQKDAVKVLEKAEVTRDEQGDVIGISLSISEITDDGLAHRKGLTKLEQLNLNSCENITDSGAPELQKALPNCEISR